MAQYFRITLTWDDGNALPESFVERGYGTSLERMTALARDTWPHAATITVERA